MTEPVSSVGWHVGLTIGSLLLAVKVLVSVGANRGALFDLIAVLQVRQPQQTKLYNLVATVFTVAEVNRGTVRPAP